MAITSNLTLSMLNLPENHLLTVLPRQTPSRMVRGTSGGARLQCKSSYRRAHLNETVIRSGFTFTMVDAAETPSADYVLLAGFSTASLDGGRRFSGNSRAFTDQERTVYDDRNGAVQPILFRRIKMQPTNRGETR